MPVEHDLACLCVLFASRQTLRRLRFSTLLSTFVAAASAELGPLTSVLALGLLVALDKTAAVFTVSISPPPSRRLRSLQLTYIPPRPCPDPSHCCCYQPLRDIDLSFFTIYHLDSHLGDGLIVSPTHLYSREEEKGVH